MRTASVFVCAFALSITAQASSFCTSAPGTWCEQPSGPDAGQYINTAQYTVGEGVLNSIEGEINGLGGADMFAVYIPNTSVFSAVATSQSGPSLPSGTIHGDTQAALYLFNSSGLAIEAGDEGTTLTGFSGAAGVYFVDISGDGNLPEFGPTGNRAALFAPFVTGQEALPVTGAGTLTAYSGNGCGVDCAGGYDISLTDADYAQTPEPTTLALSGMALIGLAFLSRKLAKCS